MLVDLTGKVIFVTGSARGIGKEIALSLSEANACVVANYLRSEKDAKELLAKLKTNNANCSILQGDVSSYDDVKRMAKDIVQLYGKIDVLINNAGICSDNFLLLMSKEQWGKVVDINLNGTFNCCKAFSKEMIKLRKGKIINIASIKGVLGSEGQANYSASKAGVIGFTKAVAKELGSFNVSINAVCPGYIPTDLNKRSGLKARIARNLSTLDNSTNLESLVNFITFMSSDSLLGVNGQVFHIDSRTSSDS